MRALVLLGKLIAAAACALAQVALAQPQPQAPPSITRSLVLPAAPTSTAIDAGADGSVQFIGTATLLIRYQGITILIDPNFLHKGDHVHLGYGLRSQRLTNPALEFSQLLPIDLVIPSHLHEDHAVDAAGLTSKITYLKHGATYRFGAAKAQ